MKGSKWHHENFSLFGEITMKAFWEHVFRPRPTAHLRPKSPKDSPSLRPIPTSPPPLPASRHRALPTRPVRVTVSGDRRPSSPTAVAELLLRGQPRPGTLRGCAQAARRQVAQLAAGCHWCSTSRISVSLLSQWDPLLFAKSNLNPDQVRHFPLRFLCKSSDCLSFKGLYIHYGRLVDD